MQKIWTNVNKLFQEVGGLKRKRVMSRFQELDCAKKNICFGVVVNLENLGNYI